MIHLPKCTYYSGKKYIHFFTFYHPEVFNTYIKYTMMCQSNTTKLYYVFIVLGQLVSILIESSSGPSKKINPYLERPEDDSIRIETCCPNTIKNIIKVCCVLLTHHCIFYINILTPEFSVPSIDLSYLSLRC
jgi:hypothetical protein